jgi:hypothetical protein
MQHGHECTEIQNGLAAQTCSMNKQHGEAAGACSKEMQKAHEARNCRKDLQHEHAYILFNILAFSPLE